jgi:hypothetical protein
MKKFILILMVATLTGCDTPTDIRNRENDYTTEIQRTPGLEGCEFHEITPSGHNMTVYVVRCPYSSTTTDYQQGKQRYHITVP